ncbi:hypothetical protein [Halorubrum sp. Atlit-26R]|uniref:hypothetical protein n=1 Tax=Halorubrum sp. Atlit-26R TaxID=2282128 RepID=UPI000EF28701|nr:hypothetical protein [Halorubrum sp. Atlit-26R]RLM68519.1 hypothetical protein DVK07_10380 [Halorubrum sp. Atlit-26R]
MDTDKPTDRAIDSESEPYLRLDNERVAGSDSEVGIEGADEQTVAVRHKHEGVRFDATLDDDGYLRGAHDRYLPTGLYAIVDESPDQ